MSESKQAPEINVGHLVTKSSSDRARERAKTTLIQKTMIGVILDSAKTYHYEGANAGQSLATNPQRLRQNFAFDRGQLIHGRDVFKSSSAYTKYNHLTRVQKTKLEFDDFTEYFKGTCLREYQTKLDIGMHDLHDMCQQITINPFCAKVKRAEAFVAGQVAMNVHPRRIREAQQRNYFIIAADVDRASKLLDPELKSTDLNSVGYHAGMQRLMVATSAGLKSKVIGEVLAHEFGHMSDIMLYQSLFLRNGPSDKQCLEMSRRNIELVEGLLQEAYSSLYSVRSDKFKNLEAWVEKAVYHRGGPRDHMSIESLLHSVHSLLMTTLPPNERYVWSYDEGSIYPEKPSTSYTDRISQRKEIPAIVNEISDQYGMKVARLLMPELFRAVMDVQVQNERLSDKPGIYLKKLAERMQRRDQFPNRKQETQAAWLERLANEECANGQKRSPSK